MSSESISIGVMRHFLPAPHESVTANYECEVYASPRTDCPNDDAMCRISEMSAIGVIQRLENQSMPWISTDENNP
jgi:hypothetical protein